MTITLTLPSWPWGAWLIVLLVAAFVWGFCDRAGKDFAAWIFHRGPHR